MKKHSLAMVWLARSDRCGKRRTLTRLFQHEPVKRYGVWYDDKEDHEVGKSDVFHTGAILPALFGVPSGTKCEFMLVKVPKTK